MWEQKSTIPLCHDRDIVGDWSGKQIITGETEYFKPVDWRMEAGSNQVFNMETRNVIIPMADFDNEIEFHKKASAVCRYSDLLRPNHCEAYMYDANVWKNWNSTVGHPGDLSIDMVYNIEATAVNPEDYPYTKNTGLMVRKTMLDEQDLEDDFDTFNEYLDHVTLSFELAYFDHSKLKIKRTNAKPITQYNCDNRRTKRNRGDLCVSASGDSLSFNLIAERMCLDEQDFFCLGYMYKESELYDGDGMNKVHIYLIYELNGQTYDNNPSYQPTWEMWLRKGTLDKQGLNSNDGNQQIDIRGLHPMRDYPQFSGAYGYCSPQAGWNGRLFQEVDWFLDDQILWNIGLCFTPRRINTAGGNLEMFLENMDAFCEGLSKEMPATQVCLGYKYPGDWASMGTDLLVTFYYTNYYSYELSTSDRPQGNTDQFQFRKIWLQRKGLDTFSSGQVFDLYDKWVQLLDFSVADTSMSTSEKRCFDSDTLEQNENFLGALYELCEADVYTGKHCIGVYWDKPSHMNDDSEVCYKNIYSIEGDGPFGPHDISGEWELLIRANDWAESLGTIMNDSNTPQVVWDEIRINQNKIPRIEGRDTSPIVWNTETCYDTCTQTNEDYCQGYNTCETTWTFDDSNFVEVVWSESYATPMYSDGYDIQYSSEADLYRKADEYCSVTLNSFADGLTEHCMGYTIDKSSCPVTPDHFINNPNPECWLEFIQWLPGASTGEDPVIYGDSPPEKIMRVRKMLVAESGVWKNQYNADYPSLQLMHHETDWNADFLDIVKEGPFISTAVDLNAIKNKIFNECADKQDFYCIGWQLDEMNISQDQNTGDFSAEYYLIRSLSSKIDEHGVTSGIVQGRDYAKSIYLLSMPFKRIGKQQWQMTGSTDYESIPEIDIRRNIDGAVSETICTRPGTTCTKTASEPCIGYDDCTDSVIIDNPDDKFVNVDWDEYSLAPYYIEAHQIHYNSETDFYNQIDTYCGQDMDRFINWDTKQCAGMMWDSSLCPFDNTGATYQCDINYISWINGNMVSVDDSKQLRFRRTLLAEHGVTTAKVDANIDQMTMATFETNWSLSTLTIDKAGPFTVTYSSPTHNYFLTES